jgi:hypothetical protein
MGKSIDQSVKRINYLIAQYAKLPDDLEIRSHWARYVCVMISGLLETAVEELCSDYAQAKGHANLAHFVGKSVVRNNKADVKTICETLGRFNGHWQQRASELITDEQKLAINSVVGLRHGIAHGRGEGVSWTVLTADYYPEVLRAIKELDSGIQNDFA